LNPKAFIYGCPFWGNKSSDLHLWDAQGNVIQQWDGILKETDFENPTQEQVSSQWTLQSGGYFMSIPYVLPSALPSGEYSLNLTLYDWEVASSGLPIMQEHAKSMGRNFIRLEDFIR